VTKTGAWRRWPLIPQAVRLLRERREAGCATPLPKISDQALNRRIKEVATRAGITTPVRLSNGREVPKCEVLTSHSGRKTFATTVTAAVGVSPLLGLTHENLRTLEAYVGAGDKHRRHAIETAFEGFDW